jgi:hypothetical protein
MSKAQILAKSILAYFQNMNDPFFSNLEDISEIENMAREILKDVEHAEPTETPLSHETLLSLGYTLTYNCFTIGQRCYTEKNSMNVIEHTNEHGEKMYTIGQTFKEVKTVKDLK